MEAAQPSLSRRPAASRGKIRPLSASEHNLSIQPAAAAAAPFCNREYSRTAASASMQKGAVKKFRNDTAATPPHCHFDRSRSADNRKASHWAG